MKTSKKRGDLPLYMQVSTVEGEELYKYSGNLMMRYASQLLSQWIMTGSTIVEPTARLVMIAEDRGEHWVLNRSRVDTDEVEQFLAGLKVRTDSARQMAVWARTITIYNPEREQATTRPVAKMRSRLCGGSDRKSHTGGIATELLWFDASLNEAAGVIHELEAAHLCCTGDVVTRNFLSEYPLSRAVTSGPKGIPSGSTRTTLSRTGQQEADTSRGKTRDAELARIFANARV